MIRLCRTFCIAAFIAAFFMRPAQGHELGCFGKDQAEIIEPKEWLRGYGTTSEGLVKLSVTSSGAWMLTFSPPKLDGAVCIVWLGENWQVITSAAEEKARWTAR
ncbi:hypothetical protein [uncultured Mediterranean phage uvMED]|nr:hypothetical protein [uncultured Mediterranean phage uvMED]BAR15035.1 hypothetical protein [uncultured Mediterranean phage uvMED]